MRTLAIACLVLAVGCGGDPDESHTTVRAPASVACVSQAGGEFTRRIAKDTAYGGDIALSASQGSSTGFVTVVMHSLTGGRAIATFDTDQIREWWGNHPVGLSPDSLLALPSRMKSGDTQTDASAPLGKRDGPMIGIVRTDDGGTLTFALSMVDRNDGAAMVWVTRAEGKNFLTSLRRAAQVADSMCHAGR